MKSGKKTVQNEDVTKVEEPVVGEEKEETGPAKKHTTKRDKKKSQSKVKTTHKRTRGTGGSIKVKHARKPKKTK